MSNQAFLSAHQGFLHPGQQQEVSVVDQAGKIGLATGLIPADPAIPGLHTPGGRGELQAAQHGVL